MASTIVETSGDASVSTQKAAERLQANLRLSMKPENSLPEMLMVAPFAINFLGRLRLLAFSDSALRIPLEKPDKGFDYLKYPSLASAMQQILQQASKAFNVANDNMWSIDQDMRQLFGKSSYAQDILICLKDLVSAKRSLRPAMENLRTGMSACAEKAKEIKREFDILVATCDELNIAMGHQMNVTEMEKREADKEYVRAEENTKFQNFLKASLEQEYERFSEEAEKDRKSFDKTARRGEWRALGLKTVMDAEAGIAGLISGAVGIIKSAPSFATQAVAAAGSLGGAASQVMSTGSLPSSGHNRDHVAAASKSQDQHQHDQSTQAPRQASGVHIDPVIVSIDPMESCIYQLYEAVHKELLPILLEDGQNQELLGCSERLKAYKSDLGECRSQYGPVAKAMLDQGIRTADDILKSDKLASSVPDASDTRWQERTEQWRKEIREAHRTAIYLKAVASTQAGQGFGDASLDTVIQAPADPNNSNLDMASILNTHHRKLLIRRAAMEDSQRRVRETTERYRETQRRAIELASSLEHLELEKTAMEDLKKFLRKAIDNISSLQTEVRQLNEYFEFMSKTLSILLESVAHRFLDNIESGISNNGVDFGLSYGQAQTNIIRQTIFSIRGHVTFIVESTRLYRGISKRYIQPCMRMAANLPLEASAEEQDRFRNDLKIFTSDCGHQILTLANEELKKTNEQLDDRFLELDEATLGLPEPPEYVKEAIEEGIQDASRQKQAQAAELQKLNEEKEICDDILG